MSSVGKERESSKNLADWGQQILACVFWVRVPILADWGQQI